MDDSLAQSIRRSNQQQKSTMFREKEEVRNSLLF
jgi:hypothetical protein